MKTTIDVENIITRFKDMAKRESLLTGNVSQEDLLIQIIGAIVVEAMNE